MVVKRGIPFIYRYRLLILLILLIIMSIIKIILKLKNLFGVVVKFSLVAKGLRKEPGFESHS